MLHVLPPKTNTCLSGYWLLSVSKTVLNLYVVVAMHVFRSKRRTKGQRFCSNHIKGYSNPDLLGNIARSLPQTTSFMATGQKHDEDALSTT